MLRREYRAMVFTLAALLTPAGLAAQQAVPVSITVGPVLYLNASGSFSFATATDDHYTAGLLPALSGPTLTHRANVPYQITIQAQTGSTLAFSPAGGRTDTDPAKPTSDLELRLGGAGSFLALPAAGGTAATLYTRAVRGGTITSTIGAQLKLSYDADPPGTYSTTVVFTIVAQ
jgi:hypothetical protein